MRTTLRFLIGAAIVLPILYVYRLQARTDQVLDDQRRLVQETVRLHEDLRKLAEEQNSLRQDAIDQARQQVADLQNRGLDAQMAAPAACPAASPQVRSPAPWNEAPTVPGGTDPKGKSSPASLYECVRQLVSENKTEETERIGMGDIAYRDVPDNGAILVGMEVAYAPFFNHEIVKSVRPIYQKSDGKRFDGSVCGTPTKVGERIVAKDGCAIGAIAIRGGMGIDSMQLTFMEIGRDGLNTNKTQLSKWLGSDGGTCAKTYVNDGRPIVGIAGMKAKNPNSPAFCLCMITLKQP